MAQYDQAMLEKFVDRLYRRAAFTVVTWTLLGGTIGVMAGSVAPSVGMVLLGVLGAVVGLLIGQEKSFMLRVEGQRIMVLVQVEKNIRFLENLVDRKSGPG